GPLDHRIRRRRLRVPRFSDALLGRRPRHRHGGRDLQGAHGQRLFRLEEWLRASARVRGDGAGYLVDGPRLSLGRPGDWNREGRGLSGRYSFTKTKRPVTEGGTGPWARTRITSTSAECCCLDRSRSGGLATSASTRSG